MMSLFRMKGIFILAFMGMLLLSTYPAVTNADDLEPTIDTIVGDSGATNDAQMISDTIPTSMEAGKSYAVTVVVKNTGSNAWTASNRYRLGAAGGSDPFTTTLYQNLGSSDSITPGQQKTFKFTLTAPSAVGTYTTDWRMQQGGVAWFGGTLTKTVTVVLPANDAQPVSDKIPTTMEAGKSYAVSVILRNTGTNTWTAAKRYRLGAVGGSDPFTATIYQSLSSSDSIATGQQKTFKFILTAPTTLGTYTTDWRMQQGGVAWFGMTLTKTVTVIKPANGAEIVSDTIPTTMETGKSYAVSVIVKNTGTNTWTALGKYRLGAVGGSDPFTTILYQSLGPNDSIATGQKKTFKFTLTAPATDGTYTTDWRMMQGGVEWFGGTLKKTVAVAKNAVVVTGDGHGFTLPSGNKLINSGAPTNIAAIPHAGYHFVNWVKVSGNGVVVFKDMNAAHTTVTVTDGVATIRANFAAGIRQDLLTVTAGNFHGLALKSDGSVYSWGYNPNGQLGNGTSSTGKVPGKIGSLSNIKAIGAGAFHSLGVKFDGTVWTWGRNTDGQLGTGTYSDCYTPVQVSGLTGIVAVTGGDVHSLALKNDGTVWAWGRNNYGQLGNSNGSFSITPVQVANLTHVIAIASKGAHCLALKSDGTVWAWGDNGAGQLGDGSNNICSYLPVQVIGLTHIVSISAGMNHCLAVAEDGQVWAWGRGNKGQLGNAANNDSHIPVAVQNLTGVIAVAGGGDYSMALKNNGTVWAWGDNIYGQLGTGDQTSVNLPAQVNGLTHVVAIAGGDYHALALRDDDTVWAWGFNGDYELGNGTYNNSNIPAQTSLTVPDEAVAVAGGVYHSLAIRRNGSVWSWGYNAYSQLGNGTKTNSTSPGPCGGLTNVVAATGGYGHSLVLKSDGTLWAWGENPYGELGDGTDTDRTAPVQVSNLANIVAVRGNGQFNLALRDDGTVWTWGLNDYGQLGNGTDIDSSYVPAQAINLTNVVAIACGYSHSLALRSDGTVWAWGDNYYGQLGNGNADKSSAPVQVSGLTDVIAIAGGGYHSLALKSDGTVWAWGNSTYGQGGGGTEVSSTPLQISGLTGIVSISAGGYYSFALGNDGTVWAWGRNDHGQLGIGGNTTSKTPVQVNGLSHVVQIAGCWHHNVALAKDGSMWAWGGNESGELGIGTLADSDLPVSVLPFNDDNVIDLSNTGTRGVTFGKNDHDQVKRFQTFVANGYANIYGVDVKIRKNNQSTAIYNTITVELYETDSNQMPTNLLASTTVGTTSLGTAFTVVNAPLKYEGLVAGKTYAVVLGQSDVANVTNNGFEWVTQSNAGSTLKFGKYNGTGWVDETSGLGNGWLKVYATIYSAHQASPGSYDLQYCQDQDPMKWVYRTGTYEVAVRFPAESIAQYQGGQVTKVWINAIGQACKIRLYGNGTSSSPGAVLSELSYTEGQITGYGWHEIDLPTPLTIGPGDLWVSYEFQIAAGDTSHGIGADSFLGMGTDGSWARVDGGAWDTEWGSIWKLKLGIAVD